MISIYNESFEKKLKMYLKVIYKSNEGLKDIKIPIPSLAIQNAIVEKLDVLNSNIENSTKMIEEYRKIIKFYVECQTKHEKEEKIDNFNYKDYFDLTAGTQFGSSISKAKGSNVGVRTTHPPAASVDKRPITMPATWKSGSKCRATSFDDRP